MGAGKASLYRANIGLFPMAIFHSQPFPSTRTPSSHKKKADALTFGRKADILEGVKLFLFACLSFLLSSKKEILGHPLSSKTA